MYVMCLGIYTTDVCTLCVVYVHHVCMFTFALLDIITFAIKISITCTTYKPRHINNGLISVPPPP